MALTFSNTTKANLVLLCLKDFRRSIWYFKHQRHLPTWPSNHHFIIAYKFTTVCKLVYFGAKINKKTSFEDKIDVKPFRRPN